MATRAPAPSVRARRVAVLVDTSTTWGREIIGGIHDYARTHGRWHLFLEARGARELMVLPEGWRGDGVIARVGNAQLAGHLKSKGFPVVNVSSIQLPGAPFPSAANDVGGVASLAVNYFRERGFRNFAYLSLSSFEYVVRQRDAFVSALASAGLACAAHSVESYLGFQSPHWNIEQGKLGAWLASLPKPVALLTWSGGREVIHACLEAGLRVPEDVAILNGSEDALLGESSPVPVSGVQADGRKIGLTAAALLDRIMEGKMPKASTSPVLVPPRGVITRQSTETLAITDPAVAAALAFIRENIMRPLPVTEVARRAGLSRRMLERRFRDTLRRSPAEHIGKSRLDRVRALVAETDLPVNGISDSMGFCSPEYMTAMFKREIGATPLRYRRQMRGGIAP